MVVDCPGTALKPKVAVVAGFTVELGGVSKKCRWAGLLLGVELVLQLHEFTGRLDLVGNLLPLREEALALLEGQVLRCTAGDGVLLLLTLCPFVLVDFTRSYKSC